MEEEKPMAEPVRNDEPLSDMRFPEPSAVSKAPGPVPMAHSAEPAGLLPDALPDRPLGEWPAESRISDTSSVRASGAGERVGSALGAVVTQTREFGGLVQDRMSDLKKKFRVITGRRSADLKQRASELGDEAQQRASELADEARREVRHWEFRARLYARDYPFRFVGVAAASGFVIGFLVRMWRDE